MLVKPNGSMEGTLPFPARSVWLLLFYVGVWKLINKKDCTSLKYADHFQYALGTMLEVL